MSKAGLSLEEICLPIKQDLLEVEQVIQRHLASSVSFITDIAEYVIRNGGKRLRPILCLFSSRLAGATGPKVTDCASAMEFFHTATLMHDDVIDNAQLRRGKASANARWGNHVSVLVGDFFYCQASRLLVGTGNLKVIHLITQAMLATTEGEILEISKSNDLSTSEEDYLKIVTSKTAVLMASSCRIGGLLGNISEEYTAALGDYGKNLGIAFQLADDVLDYISEEPKFGKVRGTDLREGKLTLPLIAALRHCGNEERRLIKDALIAENLEEPRFREIVSIINKYGGIETTLKLARRYADKAKESLSLFKPSMEKEALFLLASYVIERNQ
jgi:octaprenyl-diphosphate synthase